MTLWKTRDLQLLYHTDLFQVFGSTLPVEGLGLGLGLEMSVVGSGGILITSHLIKRNTTILFTAVFFLALLHCSPLPFPAILLPDLILFSFLLF